MTTSKTFSLTLVLALALSAPARATPTPDERAPDAADVAGELSSGAPDVARAADLTREAVRLVRAKDWARAEAVLDEALAILPDEPLNLYNLACARAQLGQPEPAMDALERAAAAGFSDFVLVTRDEDLAPLRDLPRYKTFVENKQPWQRRAAERVVARLRARFGDDYAYAIDHGRMLIYATNVPDETLAALKASLEAQARGQHRDLFENKPGAYVTVVVPTARDYRRIMRYPNVGGVYFNATKTLVAQRPGDSMRHEFTHALHAADVAPLGQEHAPWLVEGLGVLYEAAEIVAGEAPAEAEGDAAGGAERGEGAGDVMVPLAATARLPAAQAAARRRSLVPLSRFLAMPQAEFMKRPAITYTQSGALVSYLHDCGLLRPFYDEYKRTYDADPTGKLALEKAGGEPLEAFEAAWVKWLLAREAGPFTGRPELFLGARVAPGGGGLAVLTVARRGPAAEAGLEARDVILAVNGKPVKDYVSLRPAIGSYAPGKTVTVRVRRGSKEWDAKVKLRPVNIVLQPVP